MQLEKIIDTWYKMAQGESVQQSDVFFQFIAVWIAFNALYVSTSISSRGNEKSNKRTSDKAQVQCFAGIAKVRDWHLHLVRVDGDYKKAIAKLAATGVLDMNSWKFNKKVEGITDFDNLNEVLNCVYQVRCNLFHGGKPPENPRDRELVSCSYTIISKLIQPFLNQSFINEMTH